MTYYLGNTLTSGAPVEAWAHESQLDFMVQDSPIYYRAGDRALVDEDRKVLFKSDEPEVVFGAVGKDFAPVQPAEILQFYKELESETGFAVKSAGILKQRRIFVVASNERNYEVGGHPVKNYLVGGTENGGTMGTRISPTNIRPICENTLSMALNDSLKLSITHRSRVDWQAVKEWVHKEDEAFDLYGELMQSLYQTPITPEDVTLTAKAVLSPEWNGEGKAPRKLVKLFETATRGKGQTQALNGGNLNVFWLLSGFTRYVDHDAQARSDENRTDSAMFGPGNNLKNAVLDKLVADCVEKWGNPEPARIQRELAAIN